MKVLNDLLWDGKLKIYQENDNFVLSIDSILLAHFVKINKNAKNILDIGTGNAPIPLMLTKKTNAHIIGIEIQKHQYELGMESIKYNELNDRIELINEDIRSLYETLPNNYYDTITCNPPYYKINTNVTKNPSKLISRNEFTLNLDDIFKIAKKTLKNNGNIAIVNVPERLSDIIIAMKKYNIEPKTIQFVYPKVNKDAILVLIEGTKNGKSGLNALKPLIIHNEDNSYKEEIVEILTKFE